MGGYLLYAITLLDLPKTCENICFGTLLFLQHQILSNTPQRLPL